MKKGNYIYIFFTVESHSLLAQTYAYLLKLNPTGFTMTYFQVSVHWIVMKETIM